MHTYTRSNSDAKISHFNYFFLNLIIWKKFPNIRTLQEKRSSKGFHMEFLGADLCTLRSCCKNGDRGGIWERGCASVWWGSDSAAWKNGLCRDLESRAVARANKEGGEKRCRQLLLNVLVRDSATRVNPFPQPRSSTPPKHKEREEGGGGGLQCFGGDGDSCPACAEKEEEDSFQLLPR